MREVLRHYHMMKLLESVLNLDVQAHKAANLVLCNNKIK
jgi:hypothetical protein